MRTIPDEGRGDEQVVVVDDVPGRWEEVKERPCSGPAGGRMREWLEAVNMTRKDIYWTHVVPQRPASNTIRTVPRQEVDDWVQMLHERVRHLTNATVLVPTGEVGLTALTGKKGIEKWRGSILSYRTSDGRMIKVIPALPAQMTFKAPSLERRCRFDWVRIASDRLFPELRLPERHLMVRPQLSDVRDLLADVRRTPQGILGVDIETPRVMTLVDKKTKSGKVTVKKSYGNARVTCVAFATSGQEAVSIPTTKEYWGNARDVVEVWGLIRAICATKCAKALQNGLFDSFYLTGDHNVKLENFLYDTMDMHHAIDSSDEHSLAYIASTWSREPYWKDDGKDDDTFGGNAAGCGDLDTFWEYNCVEQDTPVLMADYTWKAIRDVQVGDQLLSVDEQGGNQRQRQGSRRWRVATVTRKKEAVKECLELSAGGRHLILTPDHQVLTGLSGKHWIEAGRTRHDHAFQSSLMEAVEPWDDTEDLRNRGWMGGFLDGEGCVNGTHMQGGAQGTHRGYGSVSFSQNPGDVLDRACAIVHQYRLPLSMRGASESHHNTHYGYVRGGPAATIRLLGLFKPIRLQNTFRHIVESGHIRAVCLTPKKLTGKAKVGLRHVVDITTTTGTFIANGFVVHNCRDAAVTCELAHTLRAALVEDNKWDLYREHYVPLRAPLLDMMLTGIRRDGDACKKLAKELRESNAAVRTRLDELVREKVQADAGGVPLTPKEVKAATVFGAKSVSPKKLAWWLYDVLRVPKRTKKDKSTGLRKVTTDEVALRSLAITYPAKVGHFMPDLLEYRRNDKVGSFLKEEVVDGDGYVRCSYRRATETHRLSSSKNPRRTGQNLQNVDRTVRRVYVPDPGTVFVECDLSQAEDRVVKAYTGDPKLIAEARTLPHEFDVHTANAANIFQCATSEVTKAQRYLGKKAVHACHDEKTEVLTTHGWKQFPDVALSDAIAVWDTGGTITFEYPAAVWAYDYKGVLYGFDSATFSQHVTPEHQMRYKRKDGWKEKQASQIAAWKYLPFPVSGYFSGACQMPDAAMQLLVAIQADGCWPMDEHRITIKVKRERKITRLRHILTKGQFTWDEHPQKDGCVAFKFYPPPEFNLCLNRSRQWTHGVLSLSARNLDTLLNELWYWDGHISKTSHIYYSAVRSNVEWVQTVAHLRGQRSLIRRDKGCWRLYVHTTTTASVKGGATSQHYNGQVYCVTTRTGYFLVRRNGVISVSKNSNYGMHGKRLSEELLKDGYVYTPDECQRMIDRRLEASPAILTLQQQVRMQIMRHRYLANSWGWGLSFQYERLGDDVYRRAYAYRPQSDIGILTNLWGTAPLHEWITMRRQQERTAAWRMTRLVLQVHDALVVCAPPETVYEVATQMRALLERPHLYGGVELTIPVELGVSGSWAKGKEWKIFPGREEMEEVARGYCATST